VPIIVCFFLNIATVKILIDSPSEFDNGGLVLEDCGSRALFCNVTVGRCFGMWQERLCFGMWQEMLCFGM
jgi:hypothetical protein